MSVPTPANPPLPAQPKAGWLSRFADDLGHMTLKTAGIVLLLGGGVIGGLYYAGYEIAHRNPTPVVPDAPPPSPNSDPLKLEIHGPQPRLVIAEVSSVFTADVGGPAGDPEWHIVPQSAGSVSPTHGRRVDVTAHDQGKFAIIVSVSGDGRQLATAQVEVEAMSQVVQQPIIPPPPPLPEPPAGPPQLTYKTVTEKTIEALNNVSSPNRRDEAMKVANVITTTIGQINGGFISPTVGEHISNTIIDESARVLGSAAPAWSNFLSTIQIILDTFKAQGQISTTATTVPILNEIAGVLLKAQ